MLKKIVKKLYTLSRQMADPWNLLILIILLLAFILRTYRIEALLDFHYDQGRDAKIIWDLWHNGKLFLIGPTTGLDGIFLGPFYYYLIAPFYLIGGGNPVVPSLFLSFLVTLSLFVLYKTGELIGGRSAGFIALIIGTFSNHLIFSGRWLSNPTPIYLTSILIFFLMVKILKSSKNYYWYLIYLLIGFSLQFEFASAVFYLPILLIFTAWKRPSVKTFLISVLFLFVTLLPLIIFNFKHDNILFTNAVRELNNDNKIKLDLVKRVGEIWKITKEIF
ncbi:MAG: glycosyltransferase family 39 protein [Patescibacteria group bacterium]